MRLPILALLLTTVCSNADANTVIAFFDFNNGFEVDDESPQIVHNATRGSGTLYQQRADTDGNGKGGVAFNDTSLNIDAADGRAMAWDDISKSGDNDAEFFIETSTLGFSDIRIRFDIQGNNVVSGSGDPRTPVAYDFKFDTNMLSDVTNPGDVIGTIKDFQNGMSTDVLNNQPIATNGDSFITEVIDLSAITAVNNQSTIAFRLDDFDGNDDMRIDNVTITGVATAVPEPGSLAVLSLVGFAARFRRRK